MRAVFAASGAFLTSVRSGQSYEPVARTGVAPYLHVSEQEIMLQRTHSPNERRLRLQLRTQRHMSDLYYSILRSALCTSAKLSPFVLFARDYDMRAVSG